MSKIFTAEATGFLATLQQEANAYGYSREGESAVVNLVLDALEQLNLANATPGDADALDDDTKRIVGDSLRRWGKRQSHYAQSVVAEVLDKHGLTAHLSPTEGEFDVSFAGITLRLTLPLDWQGQPVYSPQSILSALGEATVTPVPATAPSASEDGSEAPAGETGEPTGALTH